MASLFRSTVVAAILIALATGCAGSTPRPVAPPLPDVVATVDGDVRAAAMKALGILDAASIVADQASILYLEVAKTGAVPAATDRQIRTGFIAVADSVITAVGKIRAGVRDWTALRALLQPIVDAVNGLVTLVRQLQTTQTTGGWKAMLHSLAAIVIQATVVAGQRMPAPLSGGAQ